MRRMFRSNKPYFITNRTARGLPFVAHVFINMLLLGILARATYRYKGITLCCFIFMANHFHMVLVLNSDPKELRNFMNYVDGEIAKIVNRLLGITNQNVWAGNFRPQELLTYQDVIDKIAYCYLNPVTANLVNKIDNYPGISSWKHFLQNRIRSYRLITYGKLERLPRNAFISRKACHLVRLLYKIPNAKKYPLEISPFAWKRCFKESRALGDEELRSEILGLVRKAELRASRRRRAAGKSVLGAAKLRNQCIYKAYRPKSWGRTMVCICCSEELKKLFLAEYMEFCAGCEKVWECWRKGDYSISYPPGAFIPWQPPRASIVSF